MKIGVAIPLLTSTAIAAGGILFFCYNSRSADLDGPVSKEGLYVRAHVSDMSFGPGADYYVDLRILDASGKERIQWEDREGQQSWEGVENLMKSMRWTSASSFEFQTNSRNTVLLSIP